MSRALGVYKMTLKEAVPDEKVTKHRTNRAVAHLSFAIAAAWNEKERDQYKFCIMAALGKCLPCLVIYIWGNKRSRYMHFMIMACNSFFAFSCSESLVPAFLANASS